MIYFVMKKLNIFLCMLLTSACSNFIQAQTEMRLLRFPAVSSTHIAFTYAGDLYQVSISGGVAQKLTTDVGYECFARYAPDGKTIAFTGQYDGNSEVYTIPATGGTPQRLTYTATLNRDDVSDRMGPNNIVITWRDAESIVYRSRCKTFNDFKGKLFVANNKGGLSNELPFPAGGFCSYAPDKSKLALNRIFREFRTWKYYEGGMADDVWIYDFATQKTENITNNKAQDIFPMWHDDKIYFASDRDRVMNLFCYNTATKQTTKITQFTDYDVKFPSLGPGYIAFENAGYIYLFDLKTQQINKVNISIADDFAGGRNEWIDAAKYITDFSVAPDGNRVLLSGRGEVWSLPAKTGITRNITQNFMAHERNAVWSPNGKLIAYISDVNGEDEVYIQQANETGTAKQLTKNGDTYKYAIDWSPDSKYIAWSDNKLRLFYVNVETGNITLADQGKTWEHNSWNWSPDSRWLAFSRSDDDRVIKIFLHNLATKENTLVTDAWYESHSPSFSDDGKFLLFVSDRDFNPTYSNTEWNHAYSNMSKVYMMALTKKTPSPFSPKNDEVREVTESKPEDEKSNTNKPSDKTDKPKEGINNPVDIDFDGIQGRIVSLPISAANYWHANMVGNMVYYMHSKTGADDVTLKVYDLKERKETEVGQVSSYGLTADNKKMLINKDSKYYIIELPKSKAELKDAVDLSAMRIFVNRKQEWNQIYNESWRQMRDFFWDPTMHGVDWAAMRTKYQPLLPYVNHRNDLTYVIGEMIGELNCGHAYVGGGDKPEAEKVKLGLLGEQLKRDANGFYKIDKILKGANWNKQQRSPLTEMGVDAKEGDYIIAVNGTPTNQMNDIYASLMNTAGKQVELSLNSKPEKAGARKVIVVPIDNEAALYYYNWVQHNIDYVNQATQGKVGYLHIPNMGVEGLNEFVKHFYPQQTKSALIIDDRGNGGGNVSPMIIERLNRELAMVNISRNVAVSPNPGDMVVGPKVVLIDQYSASDGDIFPYRFKKYKMGKVIGKRSWGGVVGIRGSLPFVDGGSLSKPEFSRYDTEGKEWIMEGYGVDPDIEIDNDPALEYNGKDQQLDKAIEVILQELKSNPATLPKQPPYPKKNKQ